MNDEVKPEILRLHQLTTILHLRFHIEIEFPSRPRFSRAYTRVFGVLKVNSFPRMMNERVILSPEAAPMISFRELVVCLAPCFRKPTVKRWVRALVTAAIAHEAQMCHCTDQHPDSFKNLCECFYLLCERISNKISVMQFTRGRCLKLG